MKNKQGKRIKKININIDELQNESLVHTKSYIKYVFNTH